MLNWFKSKKLGYWMMCSVALLSLVFFLIYVLTYDPGHVGHGHTMPNSASGQPTELVWIWALIAFLIQLGALAAPEHKWLEIFVVGALGGALFVEIQLCPTVLAAIGTGVAYEGGSLELHLTYLILNILGIGAAVTSCFLDSIGEQETETLKKTYAMPRLAGAAGLAGVLAIVGIILSGTLSNTITDVPADDSSKVETKKFAIDLEKEFGEKVDKTYSFDPTSIHFTKENNPHSTDSTSTIQSTVGKSYTRDGVDLVYCFEGAYAEGWQGDYSKHYAYLYLWADGLYNGESNGTSIYGYWYDTEEGGEAGATLVMVDNRGRDNDMVCTLNTSKFYKWVTDVKSTLNNGRTIKAFGYYYYPTIGFYVDPGVDYVVVKSADDISTLGWSGIRVLNNFNCGAVFDADKNLKFSDVKDTDDANIKVITATWKTYTWDTKIYIGSAPAVEEAPAASPAAAE